MNTTNICARMAWALCGLWALTCGAHAQVRGEPPAGPVCPELPWRAISPAVWAWMPDAQAPESPLQPVVLVVDDGQAMLIDPGPSAAHGARAQQSLACRFRAHLRWVVLTHGDPESVRGLQGLQLTDAGQVRAPSAVVKRLAEGCTVCGVDAGRVKPGQSELLAGQVLPVGRLQVQVLAVHQAHSPGDAVLWLASQGVLWAGGLVDREPVPDAARAEPEAWLQALHRVDAQARHPTQPIAHLMAHGHWAGAADVLAAVQRTRLALQNLQLQVHQGLQRGRLPEEIVTELERSDRHDRGEPAAWPPGTPRTPALRARLRANVQRMTQVLEAQQAQEARQPSVPQGIGR